eukprot:14568404-Alexandrium_andersonii.AAC.1
MGTTALSAARSLRKFGAPPHFSEASAGGASLRAAPLGSALWQAQNFRRFRATERAMWPVGRAGTATSWAVF